MKFLPTMIVPHIPASGGCQPPDSFDRSKTKNQGADTPRSPWAVAILLALLLPLPGFAQQGKKIDPRFPFRTDFANFHLPWLQVKLDEFPPEGATHTLGGELIGIDRVNRTGTLRLERTDAQQRGFWDLPLPFSLLPYGSVWYHGSPAELRDIPLGTHLVGQFFWDDAIARDPKTKQLVDSRRINPDDRGFHWVLRLEDDFTLFARQGKQWRLDAIDLEKKTIQATPIGPKEDVSAKTYTFQIPDAARVWKGRGFGTLQDLNTGDLVLLNFTFKTMRLDGRCTDIWLDSESQALASARQAEVHRLYQREHGLAGWIDTVDDKKRIMSVTLFDGFDPKLKEDFSKKALFRDKLMDPYVAIAVAENSLRGYDPINDVKRGPIRESKTVPSVPGSSGWQLTVQPDLMLEGFRPRRIVRLFAGTWGVTDLPREEKLFP